MRLERINQLFENGLITSEEHQFLVRQLYSSEKRTSRFAWYSLLSAALGWLLSLKFTVSGEEYALLPSEARFKVAAVLAPLGLVFYYLARREIRNNLEVGGLEIAARGQAISIAILVIVIPVLLLSQ